MEKTPAEEAFDEILWVHMAPVLKPRGFRKTGQTWRIHGPAGWGLVNVQKSRHSTRLHIQFTVNLGVRFDALHREEYPNAKYMWERPPASAAMGDCHEWRRIGQLAGAAGLPDLWWDVTGPGSVGIVVGTVVPLLEERGVPWVLGLAGDLGEGEKRAEVYRKRER